MIKFALGCDGPLFKEGKDVTSIMDAAIENGVTIFDSARHYGESERVIGEYVRSHGKREDYFIISKGCHPEPNNRLNPIELRKDIEDSLRILNAGYIDLYFLHRDQFDADLSEILMVLNEYVAAGKIRAYGLSNWTLKRIKEFNNVARSLGCKECEAISNNFTLIPWENDPWGGGEGCVSFSNDKEAYEYLKETEIPLYSYSPLARGFLSGKIRFGDPETFEFLDSGAKRAYLSKKNLAKLDEIEAVAKRMNLTIPQLTLAYLSNLDINLIPAVSTSSPKRLAENILALSIKLVPEVMEELKRIALE